MYYDIPGSPFLTAAVMLTMTPPCSSIQALYTVWRRKITLNIRRNAYKWTCQLEDKFGALTPITLHISCADIDTQSALRTIASPLDWWDNRCSPGKAQSLPRSLLVAIKISCFHVNYFHFHVPNAIWESCIILKFNFKFTFLMGEKSFPVTHSEYRPQKLSGFPIVF